MALLNMQQPNAGFLNQMNPMGLLGLQMMNANNSNQQPMNPMLQTMLNYLMQKNATQPQNQNIYSPQPSFKDEINTDYQPLDKVMSAIAQVESSGNYGAIGPRTKSGDRAFGKYQIMGNNIPVWSKEALGRSITPDEFLANPELQDQIARHKMGQYYTKYGNPNDVAAVWFSGRPMKNNMSADITGTSVPEYVRRMNQYL